MNTNEIYFGLLTGEEANNYGDTDIIVAIVPIEYWNEEKSCPSYFWAEELTEMSIPNFALYIGSDQYMWAVSNSNKEEVKQILTTLGFVYNKEFEQFMIDCER